MPPTSSGSTGADAGAAECGALSIEGGGRSAAGGVPRGRRLAGPVPVSREVGAAASVRVEGVQVPWRGRRTSRCCPAHAARPPPYPGGRRRAVGRRRPRRPGIGDRREHVSRRFGRADGADRWVPGSTSDRPTGSCSPPCRSTGGSWSGGRRPDCWCLPWTVESVERRRGAPTGRGAGPLHRGIASSASGAGRRRPGSRPRGPGGGTAAAPPRLRARAEAEAEAGALAERPAGLGCIPR